MQTRLKTCKLMPATSSNINEVIRAVLNSLFFFFYEKILHAPKSTKSTKSIKSIKRYKDTQAKAQKRK